MFVVRIGAGDGGVSLGRVGFGKRDAIHVEDRAWGVRYEGSRGMGRSARRRRRICSEGGNTGGEVIWERV